MQSNKLKDQNVGQTGFDGFLVKENIYHFQSWWLGAVCKNLEGKPLKLRYKYKQIY